MNETFRLGSLAGIRIGVNWSVLAIFVLLLSGLAAGQFPTLHPGHSGWVYFIAGAVAALVFLASLLAHELAHALVARRNGVQVEGITLWLLGGVARLSGESPNPSADLRIAAVGPFVSLALGGLFGTATLVVASMGIEGLAVGVLSWLALINVVLAVFNLIPAAPLDGGRILRAILWRRHGDRLRAASSAARAGRSFGIALIGAGVLLVLLAPGIGGLWLALVGWFIASVARLEEGQAQFQGALRGVRVGEVMTRDPLTIPPGATVEELLDSYILRHRYSSYPVVEENEAPWGLVTLQDLRQLPRDLRSSTTVDEIATPLSRAAKAHPRELIVDALSRLSETSDGRILVLEDDRIVGIVSPRDINRALDLTELREGRE